mmetsp:Transcript_12150/g.18264  ORF Transcript_12150/g.18264 Transcript_12150/m.18264 type:complete len:308 (-) Transcript_12150:183-1106(-)|eukprot:CAMPEP_0196810618 /NCGR_PEP_ID=MMETSP1362-20130617/12463_1 /TAXON_ID=163516 /ORGANISM="Leptocylindrus danicus, Strain CCMP1856" /LENGTH=307 /DNA_ID=CAMNT_0042185703 /DNA_START=62 /DNA_END=985 /DNA_ORIENTATION=+
MKTAIIHVLLPATASAFAPPAFSSNTHQSLVRVQGYLDDLSGDLYGPDATIRPEEDTHEATDLAKDKIDRAGPGDWSSYVEFNEFDGGDGQMGVAGDGSVGLEKFGDDVQATVVGARDNTSRSRSAKNAWGTSTGYADQLRDKGVETARAQQLENWANQREVYHKTRESERMAATDTVADHEEDWRMLSKYGAERVTDTNYDEAFGAVVPGGELVGTIEMKSVMNRAETSTISLKNPYMGYADFRAAVTADTPPDFSVTPSEGSLSKDPVEIIVKFRPNAPVVHAIGYLVIETEDFKKTWQLIGTTS